MSNLTNWKTLYKQESYGFVNPSRNFGIEIRVATDTPVTDKINTAMYRVADQIEDIVMREALQLDEEAQAGKAHQHKMLMECFGDDKIFVEEIPNGYSQGWQYSMSPWYRVTTRRGIITLGWRKRVISISWEPSMNSASAEELFPNEDVTKDGRMIHAYSYEKAKEYISRLLAS
jgi:hypothetical protein